MRVKGANTLTIFITILTISICYEVRIRAVSAAGNGAFSSVQRHVLILGKCIHKFVYWYILCSVVLYTLVIMQWKDGLDF